MSLHIYFEGVDQLPNLEIEHDVDTFFKCIKLTGCDYDRKIIAEVEHGKYVDNESFIDRFGRTLYRDFLSTGTKAALTLYHADNILLSGIGVGRNALAAIVRWCNNGNLLLEDSNYYLECEFSDSQIDVVCKGKHFNSFDIFSEYMMENAPYEPEESE